MSDILDEHCRYARDPLAWRGGRGSFCGERRALVLRKERHGNLAVWTIDRPSTKNALDAQTMVSLAEAIDEASRDASVRAAVLTGAGDAFVSGGDLVELREKTSEKDAAELTDRGEALCLSLEALRVPVIAVLPGVALGGGAELALACDLRIAEDGATVGFLQTRMGVTPAWGSTARLVCTVGSSRAARILLLGQSFGAEQAFAMGLVDEVVRTGQGLETASAWARSLEATSPVAMAETKALLVRARRAVYESVRPFERDAFIRTWAGPEHIEAVRAYFARRG